MSWISSFFRRDSVKAILDIGLRLLKMLLGGIANDLQRIAMEEVKIAEASGATGTEKYEMAFKAIKKRLPTLRENAINLAIELSLGALQAGKK